MYIPWSFQKWVQWTCMMCVGWTSIIAHNNKRNWELVDISQVSTCMALESARLQDAKLSHSKDCSNVMQNLMTLTSWWFSIEFLIRENPSREFLLWMWRGNMTTYIQVDGRLNMVVLGPESYWQPLCRNWQFYANARLLALVMLCFEIKHWGCLLDCLWNVHWIFGITQAMHCEDAPQLNFGFFYNEKVVIPIRLEEESFVCHVWC